MSNKRAREDDMEDKTCPSWWNSTAEWIQQNGGTIDSSLILTNDRNVVTTTKVARNKVVMTIAPSCLVSRENILSKTQHGKVLDNIITDASVEFYNGRIDLLIAVSLAMKDDCFRHYLDTLPESSQYDMLPRRWSDNELKQFLTGSSLLDRVTTSRQETKRDYEKLKSAWDDKSNSAIPFPSYSDFDDMLAAVTSRAFAEMGGDGGDAMVPLLDLCNHTRGDVKKNVSYAKTSDGSVEVRASTDLDANTVLAITYGAKGNAQLLFNYGFCIPNNIEPDGSSNDVLEFKAKANVPSIDLRCGGKSYTFGGFTKVLELFHEPPAAASHDSEADDVFDNGGGMDDMEAFLNECNNEEVEGIGWDEDDEDNGMEEEENEDDEAINAELVALAAMQKAFEQAKESYALQGGELQEVLTSVSPSKRHYAAILIASELRTIHLYELAIQLVRAKLTKKDEPTLAADGIECRVNLTNEDEEMVKRQASELAEAFIAIRHPFL